LQHLVLNAKGHKGILVCPELGSFPVTIGKAGLTANKQEGDKATPIGTFTLTEAFGLLPKPPTRLPYRQISSHTLCIDDPSSCHYNTLVEENQIPSDWLSCERMASFTPQYHYGIIIDSPLGSCLFIHVWKTPNTPTAGCIALSEKNLLKILAWLDPAERPQLIVGFQN